MDTIIGLGSAGCGIADHFATYPQYTILKIDVGLKGDGCYSLPKRKLHEDYDKGSFKGLSKFLKQGRGHVLFVTAGSGRVSGASLQILKLLQEHDTSVLYVQPDVGLLGETGALRERLVFNVLQQYARSGLFERMYLVANLDVEAVVGDIPMNVYYDRLNETVASTLHMINVFGKTEASITNYSRPPSPARISTFGVIDMEKNEEKLFFPLDIVADKCYYYAINQKAIEEDGELYRNIRDQIRERTKDGEYGVSYQIHTTSYEENYVYCVAHSKAVQGQKNFEKVLDNP